MTLPALKRLAGHPWLALEETASTNDEAWKALEAGRTPGLVVTARGQTAGRGREGRGFHSPTGGGLWASVTAETRLPPSALPGVTVAMAVGAAEALRELSGLEITLRWPNDLMLGALKVGGILAESRPAQGRTLVVAGIGVNLDMAAGDFPPDLRGLATSVALARGKVPAPESLLAGILARLDPDLARLETGNTLELETRWRVLCRTLNLRVAVEAAGETVTGKMTGLALDRIEIETAPGSVRALPTGHVTHLREL